MKLFLVDKVIKKLISILESVGSLINTLPKEGEKVRQSPLMQAKMWEKDESKKIPIKKAKLGQANSKRKGKRDTSTEVFNHPRKDFHA